MQLDDHEQLYHKFAESYIDQEHILLKMDHHNQLCYTCLDFIIYQEYEKMQ